ncbi:13803_t:CDS:1, partial [Entrophospora sp. SA101]
MINNYQQPNLDQVLLPIQNINQSVQNSDHTPQNLSCGYVHQQMQNYGQWNQNRNNNNNVMTMIQTLQQQQQQQLLYNLTALSPEIYNDHLNLNISSSNVHHNNDDPLISRISDRLLMIKDSIMTMNQQYAELEQDFIT